MPDTISDTEDMLTKHTKIVSLMEFTINKISKQI